MIRLGIPPKVIDFVNQVPWIDIWLSQLATRFNLQPKISAPVAAEVPNNQWGFWKNTSTNDVRLYVNDGGTLKSIIAYTFPITVTGGFALNFTVTGITSVTLPTSGTLATLAGVETLTNKTLTTPVINGVSTGTGVATANTPNTLVLRDGSGNFSAGTITATLSGSATSVSNSVTFNNGGAGGASGTTFNGSSAQTVSYNTVGASPLAGSVSLVTLGTITTGTWNGTVIAGQYGGTGVANTGKTITLGGNLITSGAFASTFTMTNTTTVTFPTTGTLATLAGSETFTNKTITSPTITGGTHTGATSLTSSSGGASSAGQFTSSGGNATLFITDTGGNGGNIKITGDGATTPTKYIRANSGNLGIVNDGYSAQILTLTDAGVLSNTGQIKPGKCPLFDATQTVAQSLPNATHTVISLANEVYDPDNCYNPATYRFTPNVQGYYMFNGQVGYTTSVAAVTILATSLAVNGAISTQGSVVTGAAAGSFTASVSGMLFMNGSTDYVELWGFQNNGAANNTVVSPSTFMSGFLVRAT